jgi:hypothetical protein
MEARGRIIAAPMRHTLLARPIQRIAAVLLVATVFAQFTTAAVRGDHAAYIGGTAAMPRGVHGALDLTGRTELVFSYRDGSFRIPYSSISSMEFGQKVGRRVGATIAWGVTTLGIGALPILFSKKKRHFLTLAYVTTQGNEAAVFELAKNVVRMTLPTLEARTGKKVELQESNEGEGYVAKTSANAKAQAVTVPTEVATPATAQPSPAPVIAASPATPAGLVLITFASNPPGALVSFSGMGICYTPCFTKLQPQRYKLKMKLAGYADWPGEIIVEAGKPATVVVDLQR